MTWHICHKKLQFLFVFSTYLHVFSLKFRAGALIRCGFKFHIQQVVTIHAFGRPHFPKNTLLYCNSTPFLLGKLVLCGWNNEEGHLVFILIFQVKLLGPTYLGELQNNFIFILFLCYLSPGFTMILSRIYMSNYISMISCRRYKEIQYKYNKNNFWSCTNFNTLFLTPMVVLLKWKFNCWPTKKIENEVYLVSFCT